MDKYTTTTFTVRGGSQFGTEFRKICNQFHSNTSQYNSVLLTSYKTRDNLCHHLEHINRTIMDKIFSFRKLPIIMIVIVQQNKYTLRNKFNGYQRGICI